MTRLRLWFACWLAVLLSCLLIEQVDINRRQAVKMKLNRREISARQWEIDQARSRNRELDMLRWEHRQTELQYSQWVDILDNIWLCSVKYSIRPELIISIIHRESFFDTRAQSFFSSSDQPIAQGLMQINTAVWRDELKIDDNRIMDVGYNIDLGCRILKIYLDETGGDEMKAAQLYNCGYRLSNPRYVPRIQSSKFYREVR
jgi:soluble lytic murein transglycosylase-like protein